MPRLHTRPRPHAAAAATATTTTAHLIHWTSQDLNGTISVSVEQRPELCGVFCKSLLYPYFGVSWSRECYCGSGYGSLGRSFNVRSLSTTRVCFYGVFIFGSY